MQFDPNVFDVWAFRRTPNGVRYLLLYTSIAKAERYFNGGRFWQIPSGVVAEKESVTGAVQRLLAPYGLTAQSIWAAEHVYVIYNRRFEMMQAVAVYAAEVDEAPVRLNPDEHAEFEWLNLEECLQRVHYRGLKDGVRSVHEYVTGTPHPAPELCLFPSR
jgi:hypothetical protein